MERSCKHALQGALLRLLGELIIGRRLHEFHLMQARTVNALCCREVSQLTIHDPSCEIGITKIRAKPDGLHTRAQRLASVPEVRLDPADVVEGHWVRMQIGSESQFHL